jgi:hypothetical protein
MKNKLNPISAFSWGSLVGTVCLFSTPQSASALTFVLDFNDSNQANTSDIFGTTVSDFDVTDYGFNSSQYSTVTSAILDKVKSDYQDIPDVKEDARSPFAAGKELNIDFQIGNIGTAPSNGDSEYYFMQIGDLATDPNNVAPVGVLGIAALDGARNSSGSSDPFAIGQQNWKNFAVGSVYTNRVNALGGVSNKLTSGNLDATVNAISGTLSHEIGHALSLEHMYKEQSVSPSGAAPIMGTGALDLPNSDRIKDREFAYSGYGEAGSPTDHIEAETEFGTIEAALDMEQNPFAPVQAIPSGAPVLNHVSQLGGSIGLQDGAASVPFEFSPTMGIFLVGSTWGFASLRKRATIKSSEFKMSVDKQ